MRTTGGRLRAPVRVGVSSVSRFLALLVGVLVTGCACEPSGSGPVQAEPAKSKVLLIGIDGVRPDVMAEVPTPNLDALAGGGRFITDAQTTTPSVSGPAWSSMLTGVWPDKHGVTDNEFTGKRYDEFPDFLTRIEQGAPRTGDGGHRGLDAAGPGRRRERHHQRRR